MSPINKAVRALRDELGDSQQAFATRLGLSIRAIVNYESSRTPNLKSLYHLVKLAKECNRHDLAKIFYDRMKKDAPIFELTSGKIESIASNLYTVHRQLTDFFKKNGIDPKADEIRDILFKLALAIDAVTSMIQLPEPDAEPAEPNPPRKGA